MLIGLDPGLALMLQNQETPLYARLHLRLGYCVTDWFQLTGDMRYDLLVTGVHLRGFASSIRRFGVAGNFFALEGWFLKPSALFNIGEAIYFSPSLQSGYEFMLSRFAALGFALSGAYEVPIKYVDGEASPAWVFGVTLYLTAYDLLTRRGRDPGAP
jgi:hypothetical protein